MSRRSAISRSRSDSSTCSTNARVPRMDWRVSSQMFSPPTVTARVSGRRRAPLQARQGTSRMYCSSRSRWVSEPASRWRRSTFGTMPSNVLQ